MGTFPSKMHRLLSCVPPRSGAALLCCSSVGAWRVSKAQCDGSTNWTPWVGAGCVVTAAGAAAYYWSGQSAVSSPAAAQGKCPFGHGSSTTEASAAQNVEMGHAALQGGKHGSAREYFQAAADQGDAIGQSNLA